MMEREGGLVLHYSRIRYCVYVAYRLPPLKKKKKYVKLDNIADLTPSISSSETSRVI